MAVKKEYKTDGNTVEGVTLNTNFKIIGKLFSTLHQETDRPDINPVNVTKRSSGQMNDLPILRPCFGRST